MDEWSEPYSEQVVLMEGQGIWYFRPSIEGDLIKANLQTQVAPPRQFTKADFDLAEESFVYFLPQSTFKIHPLYDLVLRDILSRAPDTAWLVVMGGHRPKWTETYRHRLHSAFGPSLSQRLCIISRVSSEQFTALLNIADVILHPFPFDGSKTSADALSVGKPLVTLPTEYLRGRMGAAFLRTMNIPELVARSANEYVDIAVALASDVQFYDRVSALIVQRVDLIWEDMQVPYTWSQFLSNALQLPLLSWEDFLKQLSGTGRNYSEDASRARMREENSRSFDRAWGPEHWLVGRDGAVHLESTLADAVDEGEASAPCIFRNWHCGPYLSPVGEEHSPHQNTYYSTNVVDDIPSPNSTAKSYLVMNPVRHTYLLLAKAGKYREALPYALSIYERNKHEAVYLLELGAIYIYLGDYLTGYSYCSEARQHAAMDSYLVHACLGVSGMYLPEKSVETIASFTTALRLLDSSNNSSSSRSQVRVQSGGEEHRAAAVVFSPVFLVTPAVLENNLLTAFRSLGHHHECLDWLSQRTGIPAALVGGAYIIVFSLVDWSDDKLDPMSRLESLLRANGAFSALDQSRSLWTEIKRMQSESNHLITAANECLNGMSKQLSLSSGKSFLDGILKELMVMLSYSDSSSDEGLGYHNSIVNASLGVALILQYYVPNNDTSKSRDIDQALVRNLLHRAVSDVYLLNEREFDFSEFPHSEKIHQFVIGRRLTFKTAFTFANRFLVGRTAILGNWDLLYNGVLLYSTQSC